MPIVNLNSVLIPARKAGYAVGAFNINDIITIDAIINAAEALAAPVIINLAEVHLKYCNLQELSLVLNYRAKSAKVPVVLNLDHGMSPEMADVAMDLGFSSVMIDASTQSFEENIRITKMVVQKAHARGVSVEAELGHVSGGEGNAYGSEVDSSAFTVPEKAAEFVEATGVDALAIAFGSVHGQFKSRPQLDIGLLQRIAQLVAIPLVLHGGSGIPDDQIQASIRHHISKINIGTELGQVAMKRMKELLAPDPIPLSYPQLLLECQTAVCNLVKSKISLFGSQNRVTNDVSP